MKAESQTSEILLWWYYYPSDYPGMVGTLAVAAGAAAAYYTFGSPITAVQLQDWESLALGYATGMVVSTGVVKVMEPSCKQYMPAAQ